MNTVAEFLKLGGRLHHFRDDHKAWCLIHDRFPCDCGARIVTIAYFRDQENREIYFGASVFVADDDEPLFDKTIRRRQNDKAVERATTFANIIPDHYVLTPELTKLLKASITDANTLASFNRDYYLALHRYIRNEVKVFGTMAKTSFGLLQFMKALKKV